MLKSNLKYEDQYMYFAFDGIHSSQYNLIIQNDIEDLKFNNTSGGKINFTSPQYQSGQYVLGVTHPQRKFPLKLVAEGLNRAEISDMLKWLSIGKMGRLIFDFAPDWAFDVIVNSDNEANLYSQNNDLFIVAFNIEFVTTIQPYAVNRQNGILECNDLKADMLIDKDTWIKVPNTAINNSKYLPSSIFGFLKSSENNLYTVTFEVYICHLGNKNAIINIDNVYKESNGNSLNNIYLSIEQNDGFTSLRSYIDTQINTAIDPETHVIQYKGNSHLFFADNLLPQQAYFQSHFDNKKFETEYSFKPLQLTSPGAPVQFYDINEYNNLKNQAIQPWLICKINKNQPSTGAFGLGNFNDTIYSHTSDVEVYIPSVTTSDDIFSIEDGYYYYFMYYTPLTITTKYDYMSNSGQITSPLDSSLNSTIHIQQYTEAI